MDNLRLWVWVHGIPTGMILTIVHARHSYGANEILWNHQFVDIIYHTPDGHRYVDYTHFHDVLPV
jgi:inward rectifier potassium channel